MVDDLIPQKKEHLNEPVAGPEEGASSKRTNINLIILASVLILAFLAIVFVPRFLAGQEKENNKYNGFDFSHQGDYWVTAVNKGNQPYQITFYYHPRELQDIVLEPGLKDKFFALQKSKGSIFITIDPDAGNNRVVIAGAEISKITGERFGILNVSTHSAFTHIPSAATVNTETPILTCANATPARMIIFMKESDKNVVSSKGNCIILEARDYNESIKVADRLMYDLLGIMN